MRFKVSVKALVDAWGYLQKIPVRPFTSDGTLVKAEGNTLTITMTDMEMVMRVEIPEVTIEEEGVLSFNLRSVMGSLKQVGSASEAEFWTEESDATTTQIHISVGSYEVIMTGRYESPIALLEDIDKDMTTTIPLTKSILKQGLQYTAFAAAGAATRSSRIIFQSVLIEIEPNEIHFIATDTINLAFFKRENLNLGTTIKFCIPTKAIDILEGILREQEDSELQISVGETFFTIVTEDFTFMGRLREGVFPDYRAIIPVEPLQEVLVSRVDITDAIDFITNYYQNKDRAIILDIHGDQIDLSSDVYGVVETSINTTISCQSGDLGNKKVSFQLLALRKAFGHFSSQDVSILFSEENKSATLLRPTTQLDENVDYWQLITFTEY